MSWSEEIRNFRARRKLTQKQVADLIGVTDQTVSNWEVGKRKPKLTPEQTLALCKLLECSLEELVAATKGEITEEEEECK